MIELFNNTINIEMNRKQVTERNVIYLDKLIDRKNVKRQELNLPNASFQFNFCDFTYEGHDNCFEYYLIQNKSKKLLTFNKQYVMIFLPNIWEKYYNKSELNYRERYILVLVATKLSVAKNIARGDEFLMETIKQLKELEENTKIIKVYDCEKVYKEEGREEGQEEAIINVVQYNVPISMDI